MGRHRRAREPKSPASTAPRQGLDPAWTGVREDFIELRSWHQAPPRPATLVRHKIGDHPTVHRHGERLTFGNRRMISALLLRSSDCRIVFPMRQP